MEHETLATSGSVALSLAIPSIFVGLIMVRLFSIGSRLRVYAVYALEFGVITFATSLLLAIYREQLGFGPNVATIVGGLCAIGLIRNRYGVPKTKTSTFGSAGWATRKMADDAGLLGREGMLLGHLGDRGGVLRYRGDKHLLTVAPTRAGKGVSAIIPNLLTYDGSALVIDPKGENARVTFEARVAMGQAVYVLDPWEITGFPTSRFNPLESIANSGDEMTEKAMMIADALVSPTEGGNEFFDQESRSLLMGLILYVLTDTSEFGNRNLRRVRSLLSLDQVETDALFEKMYQSDHHVVCACGARGLQKDPKTLANVLASAQAQTAFLDSPHLLDNLAYSDFSFANLKKQRITIYLVLPSDRIGTFHRWLRLLVQQALAECTTDVRMHGGGNDTKNVLFLLDEMAALGRLKMIEQAYGLMAGFGIQLWGIVQNLSQLETLYKHGWETFVSNSGVLQYFGSRDRKSAEYFSALCGKTTVRAHGISEGRSSGRVLPNGSNEGATMSETQRPLVFPDELMVLDRDQQILLVENVRPIRARKIRYFEDRKLRKLAAKSLAPIR